METSYEYIMDQKNFLPYRMGHLVDWMVQLAKEELNETEGSRSRALSEIKRLIAKDKELNIWTDDTYLLQFLRARKFNAKRAFDLLHHLYVVKSDFPEVFPLELDVESIKDFVDKAEPGGTYPYRDKNGSSIVFIKMGNWDPDQYPISVAVSALTFLLMQCVEDPATQVCGIHLLVDAKGISLKHIRSLTPRYLQLFSKGLSNTLPIRFRGVHIINESVIFTYIFSALKLFLTEKIKKRFHFHGRDMKHLQKYIPKEILPPEYGGDNSNFSAKDWFKKEMYPFFEKFKQFHIKGFN